ncbi:unnamed protein product [Ceratitis capitata]|uniref:(Mediterranean fruit fly) hypothetical protein n=1 Tax=Ceratitis capitata TaxID=7213 RepID=A0A811U4N0_CERCA|nr:unnamed protein product [Ceratitis capitata]
MNMHTHTNARVDNKLLGVCEFDSLFCKMHFSMHFQQLTTPRPFAPDAPLTVVVVQAALAALHTHAHTSHCRRSLRTRLHALKCNYFCRENKSFYIFKFQKPNKNISCSKTKFVFISGF